MPTLTIRNVPPATVKSLKSLARSRRKSMEQEVRDLLEEHVADKHLVMDQIRAGWAKQSRRPTASEVDSWIRISRERA